MRPSPDAAAHRLRCALLPALALALLAADVATAHDLEVGIEDERLMLSETQDVASTVDAWKDLGVEIVRLHASWRRIAPPGARAPARFAARDPDDPHYSWTVLDRAIGLLRAARMRVMLTVTGPGPQWANQEPGRPPRRAPRKGWRPSPQAFADFAFAVASRYGRDVDRYSIWNEPNLYLAPLFRCRGRGPTRRCRPEAPHTYRRLVRTGGRAIRRADPGAEIAIGELASLGGPGRIAPLAFLRELACVTASYRPRDDGPCRRFRAPRADALAYHPHSRRWPPELPTRPSDNARFGDLGRLLSTADRLTRARRIIAPRRRLTIRLTEFGYQTNPPDRARGVSLADQARYLQTALYIAWRHPRIKTLIHYQWRDEKVRRAGGGFARYSGWQSGLRFHDDRAKPALRAFIRPLVALRSGPETTFWGRTTTAPRRSVDLQRRSARGWTFFRRIPVGSGHVWQLRLVGVRPGNYRFVPTGLSEERYPQTSQVLTLPPNIPSRTAIVPAGSPE